MQEYEEYIFQNVTEKKFILIICILSTDIILMMSDSDFKKLPDKTKTIFFF